ncbi:MAG: translation elongation factor Ts [Nitrospirae bacterium]|nr:MAG: translation elongation factor Ts [Nitrospirae bacterium 13_2_20CM_2_61_4]TLY19364.1 MAG: translation elongation factor Ts [Nitrospirota bacterium]
MAGDSGLVKDLRQKTGAGIMDCKQALVESDDDVDKAIDWLRQKGLASAGKKMGRATNEGVIASYIHAGSKVGVLVEVNCETDFVARNDEFKALVKDILLQIAANKETLYVRREDVPQAVVEKELQIYRGQAKELGKPQTAWEKIAAGKLEKFYQDTCLVEQPFIKDPSLKIADILTQKIAKIGENISVRRFTRYQLGEQE